MANKRKRTKKVTVKELQSYIQGAIEFNDDGWFPDKSQWDKIVDMIMNIKEETVEVRTEVQAPPPPEMPPNVSYREHDVAPVRRASGSLADTPPVQEYERAPAPKTDMRKLQVEQVGTPQKDPQTGAVSSGIKVKTPHLSDDNYASPFE